jgi:hypothetical protein
MQLLPQRYVRCRFQVSLGPMRGARIASWCWRRRRVFLGQGRDHECFRYGFDERWEREFRRHGFDKWRSKLWRRQLWRRQRWRSKLWRRISRQWRYSSNRGDPLRGWHQQHWGLIRDRGYSRDRGYWRQQRQRCDCWNSHLWRCCSHGREVNHGWYGFYRWYGYYRWHAIRCRYEHPRRNDGNRW